MKRYALALDMVNDPAFIQEYIALHKIVRPEIALSIREAGILNMEIFHIADRLFMIMETEDNFSFEKKAKMDQENPLVQAWENQVWKFQKALAIAKTGEKWVLMEKIFNLNG